jgi:hypothetical protein
MGSSPEDVNQFAELPTVQRIDKLDGVLGLGTGDYYTRRERERESVDTGDDKVSLDRRDKKVVQVQRF